MRARRAASGGPARSARRAEAPWSRDAATRWPAAWALVTGSSRGIGEAIALELGAAGAAVVVNSRSRERAEPVARAIESGGGRAIAVGADVCDSAQVAALVRAAVDELGGLDILVNNAGAGFVAPSEELAEDDWRRLIELDLTAPFLCAQAAARHMLAAGGGVIVNIASALGHTAMPGRAAYTAAKHGLIGLTKVLGIEWADRGVRCVAVSPGYVATEFVTDLCSLGCRARASGLRQRRRSACCSVRWGARSDCLIGGGRQGWRRRRAVALRHGPARRAALG